MVSRARRPIFLSRSGSVISQPHQMALWGPVRDSTFLRDVDVDCVSARQRRLRHSRLLSIYLLHAIKMNRKEHAARYRLKLPKHRRNTELQGAKPMILGVFPSRPPPILASSRRAAYEEQAPDLQ